ncbi:MAG: adenylate kinase [Lachnospiraceae bacterium]|nr:adenylate kinase [Lachnospiraceae bacterium]
MNIIMLGAPGAGKGTLSTRMEDMFSLPHIATGDIFRENIKNNTELGKLAKSYTEKGMLVPDEVTINMMSDRLKKDDCKNGFILDGFPRTINQADGLAKVLESEGKKIDLCLVVEASEEALIDRLTGRRVCSKCQEPYHITNLKPKKDGICDKCGGELIQRKDDTIEVIKDRLSVYHKETEPLIAYYEKQGVIKKVNGFDPIEKSLDTIKGLIK